MPTGRSAPRHPDNDGTHKHPNVVKCSPTIHNDLPLHANFGVGSTPVILITPVLLLVTSPLILSEHVPPLGTLGVIFAVLGSTFLGGSSRSV
jgi:hypothetical protein